MKPSSRWWKIYQSIKNGALIGIVPESAAINATIMLLDEQAAAGDGKGCPENDMIHLPEICQALGWQGGTIHQALAEIKRLKGVEKRYHDLRLKLQHMLND